MFFDRGHPRFRNFYSPIPVNVVRVKSSVNCLFDLARVVIRVTIKQSAVCQEMPMSFKLLLLQLGFTCSTAADKLRFILLDSQCLRAFKQGFPLLFFFGCFYFRKRKSSDVYEKYQFPVFFGATDGNFMEKYSVMQS